MTRVPFGWLIRSIHAWSANLMVAAAFAHMFSVLFLKAYRRPREVTWISGAALLFLTLAFGFTGYLLPWNELSFFATRVGTEIGRSVPIVGEFSVRLLRGGSDVTGATLTRFFGVHVAILPGLATVLLMTHLWLIQAHGMSVPPSVERDAAPSGRVRAIPFVPHFALRELFGWTVVLALLAALSAYMPWELGKKADPFAPAPAGIRPEWYFLWTFQALKEMPSRVLGINGELLAVAGLALGAMALIAVPFLDRNTPASSRAVSVVAAAILVFMIAMTIIALQTEPT
jgi:cytochrome b6